MKVRIDGELQEFESIEDLEDAIDDALSISRDCGYDDGKDDGYNDGYDDGKEEGRRDFALEQEKPHRETDFRCDLYRAIYAGNVDEAKNIANMMAMVDIDRELIWEARK